MAEAAGTTEAGVHSMTLRVYYEDTDAGGMVYYANYLKFAERGRTEMLRLLNVNHTETAERYGLAFAVRDCTVDYRRAARLDDVLEVRSRLFDLRAASLGVDQGIWRQDEEVAHVRLRIVCLNRQGRPARFPDPIRTTLQPYAKERELV